ncbi:UDP-glucose--hexose-1-phosphate uridylyltransferase [Paenibacillus sp. NEAU-GSW1]|uniref:UDP-glucose--hexose-1-phosphate uridylyltransferase n=1 Tax=Paenibacillus sp. NEAU-GSW1 TaxID=2682486 RepID=UPI0012E2E0B0|nr:UDP-glucose--hexose-1-phosphate uridylyltransferase [Paenibacillus sp. NEAU-GSW1]MUT68453.1 UDP-glucose--hexose-1-phosphate uridylyltransferase [Paenibacillus sp. NEAU-GSW1]
MTDTNSTNGVAAATAEDALLLIERLVRFALREGMIKPLDTSAARNALLELFGFTEPYEGAVAEEELDSAVPLLEPLLDYGYSIGLIDDNITTYRDLLDARIMGLLMPRPSEAAGQFFSTAEQYGIAQATDAFYKLNIDSNYIRMDRIRRNKYWLQPTEYGELEITINLSKPEKDPKEIALLRTLPQAKYPKCLLCETNVGYAGRADHPARQNLRVLPLTLQGEQWYFQYSPYVYYNEHSIVFKGAHEPMVISHSSFARLLDFVEQYSHYFIGSNADLPIVGGSILSHDHFQAGRHSFPMEKAPIEAVFTGSREPGVRFGIVRWPMSVIRVNGASKEAVHRAACRVLDEWREYSDAEAEVLAYTVNSDGTRTPHNTITPIARLRDNGEYEIDLVLRNNRTSEEHPDGIFHPHQHLHHVKKENIGLIEVMGLAVLPGRLKDELEQISAYLTGETAISDELSSSSHPLNKHAGWIASLVERFGTARAADEAKAIVEGQTGEKFLEVLKDAGVYKRNAAGEAAFRRFLVSIGLNEQ